MIMGYGEYFLIGYTVNEKVFIENTAEQIAAFIMKHQYESVTITNVLDMLFIKTSYGMIDYCSDQEFLRRILIPTLAPMQMGEVDPPKFKPHVPDTLMEDDDELEIFTRNYKHDCNKCRMIGNDFLHGEEVDIYVCEDGAVLPTILVRFGDEEHEYHSCDTDSLRKADTPVGQLMKRHWEAFV